MSSTRHAKDNSVFHECSYASSACHERGLMSNAVVKRFATVHAAKDRELLLFVQYLTHQTGGVPAVVSDLLSKYPHRLGTDSMIKIGKQPGQHYTAAEVAIIRVEIPRRFRRRFLLKGEIESEVKGMLTQARRLALQAEAENAQ